MAEADFLTLAVLQHNRRRLRRRRHLLPRRRRCLRSKRRQRKRRRRNCSRFRLSSDSYRNRLVTTYRHELGLRHKRRYLRGGEQHGRSAQCGCGDGRVDEWGGRGEGGGRGGVEFDGGRWRFADDVDGRDCFRDIRQ